MTKVKYLKHSRQIVHNQRYRTIYDTVTYFSLVIELFIAGTILQGRNADALALYFGEDPAKVPLEQGKTKRVLPL